MHKADPFQLRLEVISSAGDPRIAEVAALDRALFGANMSLDEPALRELVQRGGLLFVHLDRSARVVTEAALVLSANPGAPSLLERRLPPWLGYCDGAAVSPEFRRRGLQKQLLRVREEVARERGLEALCASVRHGNLASIRAMLRRDFVVLVDAPRHFGERPQDARVVMLKLLGPGAAAARAAAAQAGAGAPPCAADEALVRVRAGAGVIEVLARQHETPDPQFNTALAGLLRGGYLGVACRETATGARGECALHFVRADQLPGPHGPRLRAAQAQLQELVDG